MFQYANNSDALALANEHGLAPANIELILSCRNSLQYKSIWLIATEQHILSVQSLSLNKYTHVFLVGLVVVHGLPTGLLHMIFGTVRTGTNIGELFRKTACLCKDFLLHSKYGQKIN